MAGNKVVLTLPLQPGAYVVNSKATGRRSNTGGYSYADCVLAGGGASDYAGQDAPDVASTELSLSNQMVITPAVPVNVTLTCGGALLNLTWKKITAIKVGSVTNTAGANVAMPPHASEAR
jgi:hypothetical protein